MNIQDLRSAIIADLQYRRTTGFIYDFTYITNDPKLLPFIIDRFYELAQEFNCDTVLGSGYGGAQLCSAFVARYPQFRSVIVRSAPHPKQENRQIEGEISRADRIIILEDAVFFGSALRTVLRTLDPVDAAKVVACLAIFDSWHQTGTRQLEQHAFPIRSLVRRHDIGLTRDAQPLTPKTELAIQQFPLSPKNLRWADYEGNSSHWWMKSAPCIHEGRVYNVVDSYRVTSYDLKTGDIVWEHILPGRERKATDKGMTQDLCVAADRHLYVGSYDGSVTKFGLDGKVQWQVTVDTSVHATPVYCSDEKCVIVNTELWQTQAQRGGGHLHCLDAVTGAVRWKYRYQDFPPSTVRVHDGFIYATANDGFVGKFDMAGQLLWSTTTDGEVKNHGLVVEDSLYLADNRGRLYRFDIETGKRRWVIKAASASWLVPPTLYQGLIVVWDSLTSGDWHMQFYDPKSGRRKAMLKFRDSVASANVVNDEEMLVVSASGQLSYLRGLNKEWENMYGPGSCTLASRVAFDPESRTLALNFRSGGLHVYNVP